MLNIKIYSQFGLLVTIFVSHVEYASNFHPKSSSGNIRFASVTPTPPISKAPRVDTSFNTGRYSFIEPIATFRPQSMSSVSLSIVGVSRTPVVKTISETQVTRGIEQAKINFAHTINAAPAKVNTAVEKHIEKIKGLPRAAIESSTHDLEQQLAKFLSHVEKLSFVHESLLHEIGLPQSTSLCLSEVNTHELPYEWQCKYLSNARTLHNCEYAVAVIKRCLQYNGDVLRFVSGEISKAETLVKSQAPMSKLSPAIVQERDKTERFLDKGQEVIERHAHMSTLQPAIDKRDHWYALWSRKELGILKQQQHELAEEIRSELFKLAQPTVKALQKALSDCRQELTRLDEVTAYADRCAQEHLQLQKMAEDLARKGIISNEETQQIFEAIKETVQTKVPQSKVIYELTPEGKAVLEQYGYNPNEIQSKIGTALQKELANQICGVINRSGKAFIENRDELVREYIGATVDCCNVARKIIDEGTPHKAIAWTKLSHVFEQATNVVIGMAKGVAHGLKDGAQWYLNARFNPTYLAQQLVEVGSFCIHACKGDIRALEAIKNTCSLFATLPLEQQAEHAMAFLTTLLMPGPKINAFTSASNTFKRIGKIITTEAAALEHLYKIEKATAVIIKGAAVPERWQKAIQELIQAGKISTAEDVLRWVEHFEAPLTSGMNKATMELASTFSRAAQENKGYAIRAKMAQIATEAESKAAHAAQEAVTSTAHTAAQGFKSVADTAGKTIGRIDHLPVECPVSKDLYNHLFRTWVNKRGKLVGGHMPRKQPGLVSEVLKGPNDHGIKEVILRQGKFESYPKTVGPDSWNQTDYSRYLKQAYDNIIGKELSREGVLQLTGIDKNGINWRMYLELKDGVYKLTTGFPLL